MEKYNPLKISIDCQIKKKKLEAQKNVVCLVRILLFGRFDITSMCVWCATYSTCANIFVYV